MDKFSYMSNAHGSSIEELYNQYLKDNNSVDFGWQKFFEGFEFARTNFEETGAVPENMHKEFKVIQLINGYRSRGHLFTKTNPVRERRFHFMQVSLPPGSNSKSESVKVQSNGS